MAAAGGAALTVGEVLDRAARDHPLRPALRFKRDGAWRALSWSAYRDAVRRTARGLMALGLRPGQGVAILGFNRAEWLLADLGAIAAGGVPAGIYQTSSDEQCRYIARHCEAAVAVLEDARHLPLFADVPAVVLMEGAGDGARVLSWDQLQERASAVGDDELERRLRAQEPDDRATLIYTSGTTGPPKAVMLSHRNLTWTAAQAAALVEARPGDTVLSYLPLSHVAEQLLSIYTPMAAGASCTFAESFEALPRNLQEVRPDFFFGVPRVWEKMQAAMQAAGAAAPPLRRRLVRWARRQALAALPALQEGRRAPLGYALARRLVFTRVLRRLGLDRARLCGVSAAPVGRETLEFFAGLGLPLMELYGMSECTGPATASRWGAFRIGSAGRALAGTEVRLADDGEILVRGPHVFLGYYKDEAGTRAARGDDGWLRTGDVGVLDAEGYLRVTDRKKDLLITSTGKNVAPQPIETLLRAIPGVDHAVVVGERRSYVAALLTLDRQRWAEAVARAGSPARDVASALTCAVLRRFLEDQVEAVNRRLARYETVRRFALLPDEFTIEGGELTATLKLRRRVVAEKYAAEVERLYAG